ncbi:biotin--[acetyl-CoA-carboxylase] ligase [Acetobacter thailandicus]|uniref:biotin--[acetyl-CoA-carboxylase] ligase n=1 Tax=Acetobacter thailandicus TaxID=1502842 RepID=UPI001BA832FE|nr:biotin--[acetyl-CoA-carboxylase] ligase [Acetobacter thailandicus]MBS0980624.1 biotin--[acetyl-CoA-carboxylase] ligase [Acetobacter thailandicus]
MKLVCPPWRLECYDELTSTSDVCKERARAGAAPGLALLAHHQTKARGSRGRSWVDAGRSLALSVLLDPASVTSDLQLGCWPFLASLAFYDALADVAPAARADLLIKWPNDILLAGEKLGGILLEYEGSAMVIGFGANLHAPPSQHDIGRQVASLDGYAEVGAEALAEALLKQIHRWLDAWAQQGFAVLCHEWQSRAHPVGTVLTVRNESLNEQGRFIGLEPDGRLLLETGQGIKKIAAGEVLLLSQETDRVTGY